MKILVVGGGTAGLIAATIIKKRFDFVVDVVRSSDIGIVGVGEGSTEHFREYLNFMQIDPYEMIYQTDSTYKVGIMFRGWADEDYLHNVNDNFSLSTGQYHHVYANQISKNSNMVADYTKEGMLDSWFLNKKEHFVANQFHFDTYKLNLFLSRIAKSMGVRFYEDEIIKVNLSESGRISDIVGKNNSYEYDFYIDATGFNKTLIGNMESKWVSFGEHLKVNSAITFQTESNKNNIELWTTATAMDHGWMFSLPTWRHIGNGYVYDNHYTDKESAKKEIENFLCRDIEIGKSFVFDPGFLDKVWVKNCLAIGLSGSFIEPLEATSIGSSIQQSFLLINYLSTYTQNDIDSYNDSFRSIMENIRDFVFLHYITKKENTEFWKEVSNIPYPEFLKKMMEIWKNRLPIEEDFVGQSRYKLFGPKNYIVVMQGLRMFNENLIKKELFSNSKEIISDAQKAVQELGYLDIKMKKISHKKFIEFVRDYSQGFT
jgi:tryptophan halogenase